MMRVRFPLSAKILAWFFLNLALLAIVAAIFLQQKLRFGLDSLVAGRAGDRVRALAILVVQELTDAPREQWNEILDRYGRQNSVRLVLFAERGSQLAGEPTTLPNEVAQRMRESAGPALDRRPPPRGEAPPPEQMQPPPRAPNVVGMTRAGDPPRYWVLIHAPLPRLGPEGPAVLLLESNSLAAGGLIFDARPLLWSAAVVLLLSVLLWLPLIRGITRNLAAMQNAAARIADGHFDIAVDASRRDELGALGAAINTMSERIAGLLNGQRRFLSDVAHELCAPLSRLQVALGILESRIARAHAVQLTDVREEVDQISALVNELLSFSRATIGTKKIQLHAVPLREILAQAAEREASLDAINIECAPELTVRADRDLLLRAIFNLLRNAVRYAADAGPITIAAERDNGNVLITIADHGPGIPEEALPHIFDPFYRLDISRARETGGVGLGLTIAKTCVDACRGAIALSNRPSGGLVATIRLPAAAPAPALSHTS